MSGKHVVRMAELEIDPAQLEAYRALLAKRSRRRLRRNQAC